MVAMTHRHQRVFKSPITPVNSYSFYCLWEENQNKKSCFPKRSERETFAYITVLQVRYQGTNVLLTFKTNLLSCQKKKVFEEDKDEDARRIASTKRIVSRDCF